MTVPANDDGDDKRQHFIQSILKDLPERPGVYRMLNAEGDVIYVGKARNLKKRVSSYFRGGAVSAKTAHLVKHIHDIQITITNSDNEALILENNLIKSLRPRYNVLLRDDKSYPYIYLSAHKDYPRIDFHRGAKRQKGRYFGPYPSAGAVRESLNLLQKLFRIRSCSDSFFRHRTRPCLQYQIKRCSAPCVKHITPQGYQADVRDALLFLEGKSKDLIDELAARMDKASASLDYETAAFFRDQIASLHHIQEKQYVSGEGGNVDVLAAVLAHGTVCVEVIFIRDGRVLGNKTFFPKVPSDIVLEDILPAFIPQYYLNTIHKSHVPERIIVNMAIADVTWLQESLSEACDKRMTISQRVRGERARWLELAQANAEQALQRQLADKASIYRRLQALQDALGLDDLPARLECFDISHSSGESTVASCVVFDSNGPLKSDYRSFNIKNITPGDDYAAMHQALTRRYTKLKKGEGKLPDMIIIDGGKGQLHQAQMVLEELQLGNVLLFGIAKGVTRKPGMETLFIAGDERPIHLPADSMALHLLQHIRDEAHRFAITGHRQRRDKTRKTSQLEGIPGVGAKRRRELLRRYGGIQALKSASVEDIAQTPGISRALAQLIYDHLR